MVYLLHFEPAYKRARHYIGATSSPFIASALARGEVPTINVPLIVAARAACVTFTVERIWPGNERERAELRAQKSAKQFCSTCQRLDAERRRA